jgi:hypothetical protein
MSRRIKWVLLACGVAVVAAGLLGVPSWVPGTRAASAQVPQQGPALLKHVAPTVPEELRGTKVEPARGAGETLWITPGAFLPGGRFVATNAQLTLIRRYPDFALRARSDRRAVGV